MKPKTRLLPAVMSILIMTSLFCPVVNAAPSKMEEPPLGVIFAAAPAIPAISEFVYAGVVFLIAGASVVEIGKHLNTHWEDPAESWDKFAKRVSTALEKVFAKQWEKTANHRGQEAMNAVYDYYTALGSPKGKDDKWYFEARRVHGEVEVNMKQLTEEQAVKKMEEGKDIMTLDKTLAENAVNRFLSGGNGRYSDLKTEGAHQKTNGYYDHIHFRRNANERLHCWIWKNT